jgi:threonine dehydrogenase-like Zn-dependent dehydrogenase
VTSGSRTARTAKIVEPTDAIVRLTATCVCGSDLWPYRGVEPADHQVMGHEYVGVVEEIGSEVRTIKVADSVVGSFVISDNTCEICRAGYPSLCVHAEFVAQTIRTQAERACIPLADGTLVATPGQPEPDLIPSLLAASDVLGTGWFAAVAAEAGPGRTVAVVGDGAVGLMAVLAARQLGAERVIAMSRHPERQALAGFYGATDIVEERGDEGVAKVKELTNGLGAHAAIEAVGTQEAFEQAVDATRPGGHLGFVGVNYDVKIAGIDLFFAGIHLHARPGTPVPAGPDPVDLGPRDRPGQGLRPHPPAGAGARGVPGAASRRSRRGFPAPSVTGASPAFGGKRSRCSPASASTTTPGSNGATSAAPPRASSTPSPERCSSTT